ncbi:MAG: glycosyltransferase [Planctomycetota bacterium]|nr:MAG: glycosyltransferase [Planctomycetota bacterium]
MTGSRVLFLHTTLSLSGATARLLRMAKLLSEAGTRVTVLSEPGSRSDAFRDADIEVLPAELPLRPIAQPFAALRTRRLVTELEPSVLHVTSERLAPLAAFLARPYVLEVQREVREQLPYHPTALRAVIVPAETLLESAVNRGRLPRDRVRVIGHGPKPPEDIARAGFVAGEPIRVGCAGRLDGEHATGVFLDAARRLALSGTPYLFFVFGEGPLEERLRRQVRELAIADCATITAPAAPTTAELLARLDIYVSCVQDGAPGWFAHEALLLGVPSIFSAARGSLSLILDGESGILVERGNPAKLAAAIEGLAANPLAAREMGLRGRQLQVAARPADRFDEGLNALYEEFVGSVPV